MGCSHSVREEKARIMKKRHIPELAPFIPIQSNVPRSKPKIVFKGFTQTTHESPKVSPPMVQTPLKTTRQAPMSYINPYRLDNQQFYGYSGVAEICGYKQNGMEESANRYRA